MTAVFMATRWFFYFYTVEICFDMPSHFGMEPKQAAAEFIRVLRLGLTPRQEQAAASRQELEQLERPAHDAVAAHQT